MWLDPASEPETLHALLRPYPAVEMTTRPVNDYLDNARNEGPQCLGPAAPAQVALF